MHGVVIRSVWMGVRVLALAVLLISSTSDVLRAQETVNYASVSGDVTDPSGGVVAGADITARQLDTNVTSSTTTDSEGRFRFPYLKVGQYEIKVKKQGFGDATREVTLTVGSAFELAFPLEVGIAKESVNVSGEAAAIETARTQVAGTVTQNEVNRPAAQWAQLSRSCAAGSGRFSHQHGRHAAFCGDFGCPGTGHFGQQPAQFLKQLHRGWSFRQRRRRRTDGRFMDSTWCRNFRWSLREGKPNSAARSAAT